MNLRTALAVARTVRAPSYHPEPTPHGLFLAAYHDIAMICRVIDRPGLAVFAVAESGHIVGSHLVIENEHVVPILLGRHEHCDVVVEHSAVALRELVIAVEPCTDDSPTYRVIDLRPDGDLTDETGRAVRSLRTDGVAILRCAAYVLFLLPLGDPLHWPARAETAWSMLPQRVYLDERNSTPPPRHLLTNVAFRVRGPRFSLENLESFDRVGNLELVHEHGSIALAVGSRALADGIVIGRSASRERLQICDPTLSRVHALLLQVGRDVVAIDLASTFGTGRLLESATRLCQLGTDSELWLGHATRLRWRTTVIS